MKKKSLSFLLTLTLVLTLVFAMGMTASAADAYAWYGDGTATVYNVSNAAELEALANIVNDTVPAEKGIAQDNFSGKTVKLTADIDLSGVNYTPIGYNVSNVFAGTLDGNGKTITYSTLTEFTTNDHHGIVGYLGAGTVKDLTVAGAVTLGNYSGAIVSCVQAAGATVTGCTNNATITSSGSMIGGIVGIASYTCTISNCTNNGAITVTDNNTVGGIVSSSKAEGVVITNCSNTAELTGKALVAGILGSGKAGISCCLNSGAITVTNVDGTVGGIIANSTAKSTDIIVEKCANTGTVKGGKAGGIVGSTCKSAYTDCYNTGAIIGTGTSTSYGSGGFLGYYTSDSAGATFTNCYSTGTVTGTYNANALIGYDSMGATLSNCYYLEGVATKAWGGTKANTTGFTSKTATELKDAAMLTALGDAYKADGTGESSINSGYPILSWQKIPLPPTVSYVDENGAEKTLDGVSADQTYTLVTDSSSAVAWSAGTYVVGADNNKDGKIDADDATAGTNTFTIRSTVTATGDVKLILCDGFTLNIAPESAVASAVTVTYGEGNLLTIYGQENGTGKLDIVGTAGTAGADGANATFQTSAADGEAGGDGNAAISGNAMTVNGGMVTVTGGKGGKGGKGGDCSGMYVYGANGGVGGIGGKGIELSSLVVNGGKLTVNGGAGGDGGNGGSGSMMGTGSSGVQGNAVAATNVNITGGKLTAISGGFGIVASNVNILPDSCLKVISGRQAIDAAENLLIASAAPIMAGDSESNLSKIENSGSDLKDTLKQKCVFVQKKLSASGTTANGKVYDGYKTAVIGTQGTVTGVIAGDDVTVTPAGEFADANVANGIKVTITYSLSGSDANCYSAPDAAVTYADIEKREITLKSKDLNKEYDGKALSGGGDINDETAGVTDKGYVSGEEFTYTFTGSQLFDGKSDNTFTVSDSSTAKTGNYNVTLQYGKLTVTQCTTPLTITVIDQEKDYDGTSSVFGAEEYVTYYFDGQLAAGDNRTVTLNNTNINAGTYNNGITATYKIMHNNGDGTFTDVTDMYANVTVDSGDLTINKCDVTITSADATKAYNGTPLTKNSTSVTSGGFVGEENYVANVTGSQTAVGSSPNYFTVSAAAGTDMNNYNVTKVEGTLTVTGWDQPVTFTADSNSKMYDGTKLTESGYTVTGLAAGHTATATTAGTITHFGTADNTVTGYTIIDADGNDVTCAYDTIQTVDGTLAITKRDVTITSADATKGYDGTALKSEEVTVSGSGFVDGEGATYRDFAGLTEIGSAPNTFDYTLNSNTFADDYNITKEEGTLTVVKRYAVAAPEAAHGTITISPENAIAGSTVTVTVTPDKGYTLKTVTATDKDGKEITLTPAEEDNTFTFTMPESAVSVTTAFVVANPFADVAEKTYYSEAVIWAAANEITNGVDATHFAPQSIATRAQFLTMLWRAAGCPESTLTFCKYIDVNPKAYYYKAVLWAIENGITNGVDDTHFAPNAQITRAQAVTFMWREAGSKVVNQAISFKDVPADSWYADAVRWAVANEITNGTTADTFSPNAFATRAHVVAFLYRGFAE